jgi:pimeloyl-ACP methyl ester carboxylesterase
MFVRTDISSPFVSEPSSPSAPEVREHTAEIDGIPVFWRSCKTAAGEGVPGGEATPVGAVVPAREAVPVYLHGVPTNSDDWLPFLRRGGGIAPDLPGFGRTGKPATRRYDIAEYDLFVERFLDHVGVERASLVVHDWGGVGLAFAQRVPERVRRLVIINCVPFLPGYRWHRMAKIWRTPVLGELSMGSINERTFRLASRESNVTPGPMSEEFRRSVLDHFDHGTQRAILRLYRSSPSEVLERAGAKLATLDVPTLVVWGNRDPYIPARFGPAFAGALPRGELLALDDAGHWPWLDRPDVIERVTAFLS